MSTIYSGRQIPLQKGELKLDVLTERLGNVEHFSRLSPLEREEIVTAGQIELHPKDYLIYREGDPCSGLFVLFNGKVNLSKIGIQGQECIISVIRPVIMFNEVAVLDGGSNPVTASAVQDCATWRLGHDRYMTLMRQYPEMGIGKRSRLSSQADAISL